jgi:hypothetical protein
MKLTSLSHRRNSEWDAEMLPLFYRAFGLGDTVSSLYFETIMVRIDTDTAFVSFCSARMLPSKLAEIPARSC